MTPNGTPGANSGTSPRRSTVSLDQVLDVLLWRQVGWLIGAFTGTVSQNGPGFFDVFRASLQVATLRNQRKPRESNLVELRTSYLATLFS